MVDGGSRADADGRPVFDEIERRSRGGFLLRVGVHVLAPEKTVPACAGTVSSLLNRRRWSRDQPTADSSGKGLTSSWKPSSLPSSWSPCWISMSGLIRGRVYTWLTGLQARGRRIALVIDARALHFASDSRARR